MAFTPVSALIGGALIGASASMMLALNGRITGISGILGGLVRPQRGEVSWRATFLAGLLVGGVLLALVYPQAFPAASATPIALTVIAGLLVGFGTQLGGGCTSGHGVCGISRFSARSVLATITFMATGALAAFVVQHVLGRAS
jgi:uncharacterized membrane protein YedE/YeeE